MNNDWYVGELSAQHYYEARVEKTVTGIWHGTGPNQSYAGTLYADAKSGIRLELTGPRFPRARSIACLTCETSEHGTLLALEVKLRQWSLHGTDVRSHVYDVHFVLATRAKLDGLTTESLVSSASFELHSLSEWCMTDLDVEALLRSTDPWHSEKPILEKAQLGVLLLTRGRRMFSYRGIPSSSIAPQSQLLLSLASPRPLGELVRLRHAVGMVLELATRSPAPSLSMEVTLAERQKVGLPLRVDVWTFPPEESFNRVLVFCPRVAMLFTLPEIEPFRKRISSRFVQWFEGDGSPEKRFLEAVLSTTRLTFSPIDSLQILVDAMATLADDRDVEIAGRDKDGFGAARAAAKSAAACSARESLLQFDFGPTSDTIAREIRRRLQDAIDASEPQMFGTTQKEKIESLVSELAPGVIRSILRGKSLRGFVSKAVNTRNAKTHSRHSKITTVVFKGTELPEAVSELWLLAVFAVMRAAGFPSPLLKTLAEKRRKNPWFRAYMEN
ncbi:MAG TPA: hypothetical protein VF370_00380 [Candidatus Cryosericum sp.]